MFAYDAENIFQFLNYHSHEFTLDHPIEIREQSACGEAEEPEERIVLVLKLAEGRGLIEGVWGHRLERALSGNSWTRNCEDAYLLRGDSEGEGEVFASPDFSTWFFQVIFRKSCMATSVVEH